MRVTANCGKECRCGGKCKNKQRVLLNSGGDPAVDPSMPPPETVPLPSEAEVSAPTMNPFVSRSQQRACYAKDDPAWDCHEFGKVENRLMSLFGIAVNSNPEGHNQYTGSAGIHKAYETASTLTDEQHDQAHAAVDAATHAELKEVLGKMKMFAGSKKDAVKVIKDAIARRRGSFQRAHLLNPSDRKNNQLADLLTGNFTPRHPQHGRFISSKGPKAVAPHAEGGWAKAHAFEGKETPEEEALEAQETAADKVAAAANAAVCKNQGKPAGISALGLGTCGDSKPVGNAWTDEAREAASAARGASQAASNIGTGQFPQGKAAIAMSAKTGDDKGMHAQAAAAHKEAAQQHFQQASNPLARKDVEMKAFQLHKAAADAHAKVAGMVTNDFSSDEQRNAFFGLLKSGGGGSVGKAAGAKSEAAHAATDELSAKADAKTAAAKKAGGDAARKAREHGQARDLHTEAAKAHWSAAKATNDKALKEQHGMAAKHHFGMAKMHGEKAMSFVGNDHEGHYFGDKNDIAGYSGGHSGSSREAAGATATAKDSGTKADHKEAAAKHREAANYHAEQGNDKKASYHAGMAKKHSLAAGRTNNMFNRDRVLDALTANCSSAEDAAALNALSDDTLKGIWNAKAPGSGADLIGDAEPERMGGVDGKVKDENDEEWSMDTKKAAQKKAPASGVSTPAMNEDDEDEEDVEDYGMATNRGGRKLMSFDELLNNVDQETRETLLLGRETARNRKKNLVWNLLAHVEDNATRNKLGNQLIKLPEAELQNRLLLLPPTHNRRGEESLAPVYAGKGGAMVENFGLGQQGAADTDDVLPILNINDLPDPHVTKKNRTA